jgi:signal peptidase
MDISLNRHSYDYWLVLGLVISVYCAINLALPQSPISRSNTSEVVQSILWGVLAVVILVLPKYKPLAKSRLRKSIIQLGLMLGFSQIVILFIVGFFSGFGKSPYSFTPLGILNNLFFFGSMLIGMELSRAWLINHSGKRYTVLMLAFVSLLYTVLSLPLVRMTNLGADIESIKYLNSTCLPLLSENLLASFLTFLAGPLAAIAYRGMLQAFMWLCPILPSLPIGLVGTIVPIIGLVMAQGLYFAKTQHGRAKRAKEGFPAGWIITAIIAVAIIWFFVGLFPIHPTTILSGSMRPVFDAGDVVIVRKVTADSVKLGDIVQFRGEEITVIHRVVDILETEDSKFFITQGDANSSPDIAPVDPHQVVGKVVFTIPKIGWFGIAIKGLFADRRETGKT